MSFTHKFNAYKNLHSLVDSCDFKAKLEEFFGSELGTYQMKTDGDMTFYFNIRQDNWDRRFVRFTACKGNLSYEVYLDDNFKSLDKFVDHDWCGYDFKDLEMSVKNALKL